MVKVSVVVPVYNVEEYLVECLDSILNQTLDEIEIILVNDGSTDNSVEMVKNYYSKHSKVKLITKENGGLSSARNAGLSYVKGEYICFIDSDDFIEKNMLEDLYYLAKKAEADMAISKIKLYSEKKVFDVIPNCNYKYSFLTGVDAVKEFLLNNITGHAWNKIYKAELFLSNNILYPEGMLYEDIPTTVRLLMLSRKVAFTNNSYYYYRQREGAITKKITYKAIEDHFKVLQLVENMVKTNDTNGKMSDCLPNFLVDGISYNYKLLLRYYFYTLQNKTGKDEHELYLENLIKSIGFIRNLINLTRKNLLKLFMMKFKIYKYYLILNKKLDT